MGLWIPRIARKGTEFSVDSIHRERDYLTPKIQSRWPQRFVAEALLQFLSVLLLN